MTKDKKELKVRKISFDPMPEKEFDRAIFRIFDMLLAENKEENKLI